MEDVMEPLRRYYNREDAKIRLKAQHLLSPEKLAAMRMRWEEEWGVIAAVGNEFRGALPQRLTYPAKVFWHDLPEFVKQRARDKGLAGDMLAGEGAI